MPRVVDEADHLVNPVLVRYVRISTQIQISLLEVVRFQLRPAPVALAAPGEAYEGRQEFREIGRSSARASSGPHAQSMSVDAVLLS